MINLSKILFGAALLGGTFTLASAQTPVPVVLGITQEQASQYNTEFLQGNRMVPMWDANHIQASLVEQSELIDSDATEDQIYKLLKQYHVIQLICQTQGVEGVLTPAHIARAKVVGTALARYVSDGGGLFLQPLAVRYPGDQDEKYWNLVFEPLGLAYMHEGLYDKTRTFQSYTRHEEVPAMFWWTQNITPHPVTEGVKTLYLPLGERMKMELIAALLHRPKVLFLDEPTIGLDVVSQKKVREFLRDYTARNRITTLLTSHYMQDIEELCDRVIIIDHGQVFFDGALQDIIDRLATHKMMTLTRRKGFSQTDFSAYGEVLERNDNEVRLKIPRARIVAASQDLITNLKVDDFTVEDVPIEEIIREVFSTRQRLESQSPDFAATQS